MATAVLNEHILINDSGVPMISGTTTKVVEIVLEVKAYGWSPEEIHFQHPYLSLAQIHSALAYYWDNRDAIENDIANRLEIVERIQLQTAPNSIRGKLGKKGSL